MRMAPLESRESQLRLGRDKRNVSWRGFHLISLASIPSSACEGDFIKRQNVARRLQLALESVLVVGEAARGGRVSILIRPRV